MTTDLNTLAEACYDNSVSKGFWDHIPTNIDGCREMTTDQVLAKISLVHSELSEAVECVRERNFNAREINYRESDGKPEGFSIEIADAVIRCMDLCEALGVDLAYAIRRKMEYNASRPHMHGKTA